MSTAANVSLVQGGIITLPVTITGSGFQNGTLNLSTNSTLKLSGTARLYYGDDASKLGYEFTSVSSQGGNLTLYVGSAIPVGTYPLAISASVGGASQTAALTLNVLAQGKVYEIWPTASYGSYQSYLPQLQPGDVLILHQGTYGGDALLTLSGTAERPITIRGYGNGESQPILEYTGSTSNQWEIRGSNLIVEGLEFEAPQTDPVRIRPPLAPATGPIQNVTLVDNSFINCGSECVTANDPNTTYQDIRLIDNLVVGTQITAFYIGNQEGNDTFNNFLFEGNVVDGRSIVSTDIVGYGIEVKLNVEDAVLRNNYIVGARGPGIMTYGLASTTSPAYGDIVENNIVIGSCTDANIYVGAGPTIVRGNLSMGGNSGGYSIANYDNWNLLSGVQVFQNTALLNQPNGFSVVAQSNSGIANLQMYSNLGYPGSGGTGFQGLPAPSSSNNIHDNETATPPNTSSAQVQKLLGLIPSPQALKAVWPQLANGPLDAASLTRILGAVVALPNQSPNSAPRTCP